MLGSRIKILGDAIVSTLNRDADLAARAFTLRKKPYNRGRTWVAGGRVSPLGSEEQTNENSQDRRAFRFVISVSDPGDGDLVGGMEDHLGAIERIENIFANKSHGDMPITLRTTAQAALDAATAAGKFPTTKIQAIELKFAPVFIDPAFEAGYDVSSCILTIECLITRLDSKAL
jgi:hypothetical protein